MNTQSFHHDESVMGTVFSFDIYPTSLAHDREVLALARARARLHRVDAVFSTYREHSPINQLREGRLTIEEAPTEIAAVLSLCAHVRELSDGWFDPWAMPGGIDPTGLVKGWSVERAIDELISGGVEVASINGGGDIATVGSLAPKTPWRFGIQDPFTSRRLAGVVEVMHAVATSGGYERHQQLIDPHTGRPCAAVVSATVVGDDLGVADALATALAVAGERLLDNVARAGYHGCVILPNGEMRLTAEFPLA